VRTLNVGASLVFIGIVLSVRAVEYGGAVVVIACLTVLVKRWYAARARKARRGTG
jgi:hypothetical protein